MTAGHEGRSEGAGAGALLQADLVAVVDRAASQHLGQPWHWDDVVDLTGQASHPCGVFRGPSLSVFAKLGRGARAEALFDAELRGLALLRATAGAPTSVPIGAGVFGVGAEDVVLLSVGLAGRHGADRDPDDWARIGGALAALHLTTGPRFGLEEFDGFFGPLPQDNRPVASGRWADFYLERRLAPRLRDAVDAQHLSTALAASVERIMGRLAELCGPEPVPTLLHGDPQANNFVSTDAGAVMVDVAPYYGHPEADLALVDWIEPVPDLLFDAYRDVASIDPGFPARRELWRLHAYLAGVAVAGTDGFGRRCHRGIVEAVGAYR